MLQNYLMTDSSDTQYSSQYNLFTECPLRVGGNRPSVVRNTCPIVTKECVQTHNSRRHSESRSYPLRPRADKAHKTMLRPHTLDGLLRC